MLTLIKKKNAYFSYNQFVLRMIKVLVNLLSLNHL
jgi:hypothetical protein